MKKSRNFLFKKSTKEYILVKNTFQKSENNYKLPKETKTNSKTNSLQ